MTTLKDLIRAIPPLDHAAMQAAEQHINGLAKPPRSLGRLEDLAVCRGLTIRIICRKKLL